MEQQSMSESGGHPLEALFYPQSVAVVGASPNRRGRANQWIQAFVSLGYQGKIFPVHPKADTIFGYKAYPSVRDIPGPVDLVIFAVPFSVVIQVMQDCVAKKVKYVHLFTAGFSETGQAENAHLEAELKQIAESGGVRLIGPNCMGVYSSESGVAWGDEFPSTPGPIGFVSQSGQLASHFVWEGGSEGLRFSKVVSFGNASDLQCHDFLDYLMQDDKTKFVGSYVEGLKNGRAFFEIARRLTLKKPFFVWKGGQTEGGSRATQSHTASIAGSQKIWRAMCDQTGIISVNSMEETISTAAALCFLPLPRGTNVAVVGGAGGGSVTMTDVAEKEGLKVPHLSAETQKQLAEFIPISGNSIRNPLDIGFSQVYENEEQFLHLFELLEADPVIDAVIFSRGNRPGSRGRQRMVTLLDLLSKALKVINKPVYIVFEGGRSLELEALKEEAQARMHNLGLATFPTFQMAARVVSNLSRYQAFLQARQAAGPGGPSS